MNATSEFVAKAPPAENVAITGMAFEDYLAVEALSQSGAKKLLRSPLHYKFDREHPAAASESMQFGSTVGYGVLEPARLQQMVCCVPRDAPSKPSKAQRAAKRPALGTIEAINYWDDFEQRANGRIVLTHDEYQRAARCIDAVWSHPAARSLLEGAEIELSLFWHDAKYKVPCKARFDLRNHGGIADLKTCRDASPAGFVRAIADFKYHLQAGHYFSAHEHVLNATPEFFAFIAAESEEPHAVACYEMPVNGILAGQHLANKAMERYLEALANNRWPGYADTIETLRLPRWLTTFDD